MTERGTTVWNVKIEVIEMSGFRGIWPSKEPVSLDLEGGSSAVVSAENALGKSTFAEAVEFVAVDTLRKETYWSDEFTTTERVNVRLKGCEAREHAVVRVSFVIGDQCTVYALKLNGDGEVVSRDGSEELRDFLESVSVGASILDHRTFTRFVDNTLRGRGDTFSELLGLEEIALFRDGLDTLRRNVEGDLRLEQDQNERKALET